MREENVTQLTLSLVSFFIPFFSWHFLEPEMTGREEDKTWIFWKRRRKWQTGKVVERERKMWSVWSSLERTRAGNKQFATLYPSLSLLSSLLPLLPLPLSCTQTLAVNCIHLNTGTCKLRVQKEEKVIIIPSILMMILTTTLCATVEASVVARG